MTCHIVDYKSPKYGWTLAQVEECNNHLLAPKKLCFVQLLHKVKKLRSEYVELVECRCLHKTCTFYCKGNVCFTAGRKSNVVEISVYENVQGKNILEKGSLVNVELFPQCVLPAILVEDVEAYSSFVEVYVLRTNFECLRVDKDSISFFDLSRVADLSFYWPYKRHFEKGEKVKFCKKSKIFPAQIYKMNRNGQKQVLKGTILYQYYNLVVVEHSTGFLETSHYVTTTENIRQAKNDIIQIKITISYNFIRMMTLLFFIGILLASYFFS